MPCSAKLSNQFCWTWHDLHFSAVLSLFMQKVLTYTGIKCSIKITVTNLARHWQSCVDIHINVTAPPVPFSNETSWDLGSLHELSWMPRRRCQAVIHYQRKHQWVLNRSYVNVLPAYFPSFSLEVFAVDIGLRKILLFVIISINLHCSVSFCFLLQIICPESPCYKYE